MRLRQLRALLEMHRSWLQEPILDPKVKLHRRPSTQQLLQRMAIKGSLAEVYTPQEGSSLSVVNPMPGRACGGEPLL